MSLIFDWGGGASSDPVDVFSVGLWEVGWLLVGVGLRDVAEHLGVFLVAPVGEFVVSSNPGVAFLAVDGIDGIISDGEKGLSVFELLNGSVGFSVGGDEFHELGRELGCRADSGEGEGSE